MINTLKGSRIFSAVINGLLVTTLTGAAQAGTWDVAVNGEGRSSRQSPIYSPNSGWDWDLTPDTETWYISASSGDKGTFFQAKSEGDLSLVARWTPGSASETLPDSVNVLVLTTVSAGGNHAVNGTSSLSLSVSPGTGVETTGLFGTTVRYLQKTATQKKLFKIPTQGAVLQGNGSYLINFDLGTFTAQTSGTVGHNPDLYDYDEGEYYSDPVHAGASVNASAQLDDRSVSLSRAGAINE